MLIVSGVCMCNDCERGERRIYRMIGHCYNCRTEPILMLFRAGDRAAELECPNCGAFRSVHPQRPAREDEIPASSSASADAWLDICRGISNATDAAATAAGDTEG